MALCTLGRVLTEHDEVEQTREWIEQMLPSTLPLTGHTLVPDGRHDGLMAIKGSGEFTKSDALSMISPRSSSNGDEHYQQRPTRFVDAQTGEQWPASGRDRRRSCATSSGSAKPLSHATLRARLHEIGMGGCSSRSTSPPARRNGSCSSYSSSTTR